MSMNVSRLLLRFTSSTVRRYGTHMSYPCIANIQQRTLCSRIDIPLSELDNADFDYEFDDNSLADIDINAIVGEDTEKIEDMKSLLLQVSLWRQESEFFIPKNISTKDWQVLLNKQTRHQRLNFLQFLYVKEQKNVFRKRKQACRSEDRLRERAIKYGNSDKSVVYDLTSNSLFFRIQNKQMNMFYDYKLAFAAMFGPDIVIDCGYEKYMRDCELKSCALQIQYAWSSNRKSAQPFNIILCNVNEQSKVVERMKQTFCNVNSPETFITITNKHYTELFPREQLVYLTPHCQQELGKYDGKSVYIIGAYVDEIINQPVSLGFAKRDNLRMGKFPIDKYLNWCQGSKYLPINQCVNIMNDLKNGACWQYAFRHIAPRKQIFHRFDNDIKPTPSKRIISAYVKRQQEIELRQNLKRQKKSDQTKIMSQK